MRPEHLAPTGRRVLALLRATLTLVRLELKVVTGNRALVLAAVQAAWFVVIASMAHFRDNPWDVAGFYNRVVVVPALVPAVALGMAAIMGERDARHLEVTFVSPGGRYWVWCFRIAAILLACTVAAGALATLTWAVIDRDFRPVAATFHALFPLAFVVALTTCASVVFRSGSVAGLVAVAPVAISVMLHGSGGGARFFDLFLNPLAPPSDLLTDLDWLRLLFWNRTILATGAVAAFGLCLALLQRRERLL